MVNVFDPSSSAVICDTNSSGDPGLATAVKAGIPVAIIGGILLGVLAMLGISHWQRQKNLKAQDNSLDLARETEGGGTAVIHPFVEAPDGVKRRPGGFRKGRKPSLNMSQAPEAQGDVGEVHTSPLGTVTHLPPYAI